LFKITNIDPIKYDLLFERFLRIVSMPDIDIDFDDEGRGRVMDYVKKSMVQIRCSNYLW
jgi:DNA polymerase-3 subunit alpha